VGVLHKRESKMGERNGELVESMLEITTTHTQHFFIRVIRGKREIYGQREDHTRILFFCCFKDVV